MNEMNWMDERCGWQSKRDAKIEKLKDMEEAYLSEVEARLKCEAEIERIRLEYVEYRNCMGSENDLRDAEIARLHADLETAERTLDAQTDFRKEIERLHTENKTLFNLKLLQEEQFRYDIEQLREKYSERIYRMTTELVQRTDKIEHLTKALETLRYDYPTHLSGKAFDIVESALNSGPETTE
jgi:uncharacterized protein YydD (DUF2326 family)